MTTEQAQGWAGATDTKLVRERLGVQFTAVICAVCLRHHDEVTTDVCMGPPTDDDYEHVWQVFMIAMVSSEQAEAWSAGGNLQVGNPQSVAVICLLCGTSADDAPAQCRERVLWA